MGYDSAKAATYNKLIKQGLSQDAAADQAGITEAESSNYAIGTNGEMGAMMPGNSKVAGVDYDKYTAAELKDQAKFDRGIQSVNFNESADGKPSQQPSAKPMTYTTTSTESVSGGGTTTVTATPRQPNANSQQYADAYAAKNAEYNQFIKDNPSDFARKRQGLPPMTPEENAAYEAKKAALNQEKEQLKNQQIDAETPGQPSVTTTPNTTTTTQTITTAVSPTNAAVNINNDQSTLQQAETQLDAQTPAVARPGNSTAAPATQENPYETQIAAQAAESTQGQTQAQVQENPYETQIADQAAQEQNQDQEDPYEASRLAAAAALTDDPPETDPPPVGDEDPEVAYYQNLQAENARAELAQQEAQATPVSPEGFPYPEPVLNQPGTAVSDGSEAGVEEQVNILKAQNQATLQARQNQPSSADWRVRLQLAPGADYLYKAGKPGILAPLAATDGVVFPYTPSIETSYQAKYNQSDLTHSNYRGYFYQSSYIDHVNVRGVFTAQDTREASYLLAVIHFFRSVTKMFYGKDGQAGTPPPLVYLSGLGQYQFNNHPCVVSNFGYTLPNDVDYIRANGFNNIGIDLLNRANQSSGPAFGGVLGGFLSNKLGINGLSLGGVRKVPSQSQVNQNVNTNNSTNSTYVPTKMEISITLLPIQTRNQVSKQFSLENFANGNLLKGGFW